MEAKITKVDLLVTKYAPSVKYSGTVAVKPDVASLLLTTYAPTPKITVRPVAAEGLYIDLISGNTMYLKKL